MKTRQKNLTLAVRQHVGVSTSIAVSFILAASTATHAALAPEASHPKPGFRPVVGSTNRELLFIDPGVADAAQLLINLRAGIETIILEPNRDGIEQITEALQERRNIEAIHIVAHGEAGSLRLGNASLAAEELNHSAASLQSWFSTSNQSATKPDLLLYACNLAKDAKGAAFVEQLSRLTGADVAASVDVTGAGGNWELEYRLGNIETPAALLAQNVSDYPYKLATFTVTKTADTDDGTCDADCSLREAVAVAELAAGSDTILFAGGVTGTITLTLGEIAITDNLIINGPGATALAISGNNASRIFNASSSILTIRDLTLRDGNAGGGGGAIRSNVDTLTIEDSVITGNTAISDGGGIYQDEGDTTILRSEISNNYASGSGGGISFYMDGTDTLTIEESLITNNTAGDDGGGIAAYADDEGGTVYIRNSTISDNTATYDGGGVAFYTDDDGYLVVDNSTISGNNTGGGNGGGISFYSDDGALTITNSTISGNSAQRGGGIRIDQAGADTTIRNSTIVFNTAVNTGGGIYEDSRRIDMSDSIVANNNAPSAPDIYGDVYSSYSLIGDTTDTNLTDNGGSILDTTSGVSPTLVNAGGPTEVHLLLIGSPAIDAGTPGASPLTNDQRGMGFPRILDGRIDMGAVEAAAVAPAGPAAIPALQNWALVLLSLLMPGVALRYRRRLQSKATRKTR